MDHPDTHYFYLAPIRGVTDSLFRTLFHRHFPFFDAAVAPFINPQRLASAKTSLLADTLPENNPLLPVVPQLLYNSKDDFIEVGRRLQEMGYDHINWNLGCPAPQVANKKRGSGLLPHPERILDLLEAAGAQLDARISLKTRLGFASDRDLAHLLPQLENIPLKEIIIHPRIGKQLYRGRADHEAFAGCLPLTSHTLVYNGDICTAEDFFELSGKFPSIHRWMIGRGAIGDPFLVEKIRDKAPPAVEQRKRLQLFHDELYEALSERLFGPSHLLGRMKQVWAYFIASFPGKEKSLKKIRKARSTERYLEAVKEIFDGEEE